MNQMIRNRVVDYLFELREGKIPAVIKPYIYRREDDVLFVKNDSGFRTSLRLYDHPYDANLPCLGMLLFGMFWPNLLEGIEKEINQRMKTAPEIKIPKKKSNQRTIFDAGR